MNYLNAPLTQKEAETIKGLLNAAAELLNPTPAAACKRLAQLLTPKTIETINTALEAHYPNNTGANDGGGKPAESTSQPERALISRPDKGQQEAQLIIERIRAAGLAGLLVKQLTADERNAIAELHEIEHTSTLIEFNWLHGRKGWTCERCGTPLKSEGAPCTATKKNGKQCVPPAIAECVNCGDERTQGQAFRNGRCNRCDCHIRNEKNQGMEWPNKPEPKERAIAGVENLVEGAQHIELTEAP